MDATPSIALPPDAESGIVSGRPAALRIGSRLFAWGQRTYVMGILNVTPDSFSGDGLLGDDESAVVERAVEQARRMVDEGADLLDVGGQSTRPGHTAIPVAQEIARVEPVVRAIRAALPDVPISVDTTRAAVAGAALEAGAALINDIWGVAADEHLLHVAAENGVPIVLMHNRTEPRYHNVVAEVLADLSRALDAALAAGVEWEQTVIDPGIGFGKTPEQNLAVLRELHLLATLGRPVLLGASRKSTIGKVLDVPGDERLEGTLATTALAVRAGVDIVRVHDVKPNVRVARMADAIVRANWHDNSGQR
jgi:dihydropteroate synthase